MQRTRELMNKHVRGCLVTGYEAFEPFVKLPDEDDRHVLAAAIACGAQAIVTFNLKDFPAEELDKYGIEAIPPDVFVQNQFDLNPALVCQVIKRHRESLRKPPKSIADYLDTLEACGLVVSAEILRGYAENL
ncbi:hypothetical protein GCM10027098_28060 [Bowmanella dokdonensis]